MSLAYTDNLKAFVTLLVMIGMTPINPAIQPFWETSVTASLDTPINAPTESVAGSTTGGTATSTTASRTAELTRL